MTLKLFLINDTNADSLHQFKVAVWWVIQQASDETVCVQNTADS